MFAYIKTQTENPQILESSFTLDKTMHFHINFHKILLMQESSYTELPEWIAKKTTTQG